ncbi:hypothetical protein [Streptomyces rectiverticillatus]|uniref:hypothetical protein n=1 Tax=Streptomyces rectiverticillatus TaxID=173860 RepID=UPI0015C2D121|nr:hypothetical protein [Streptomyces rectiverticillatus]
MAADLFAASAHVLTLLGRLDEAEAHAEDARDLSAACAAPALRDRAEEHLRRSADARRRD